MGYLFGGMGSGEMIGVLAPVFGLALLDSLNPSAIAITLYLLLSGGSSFPG
jgi:hypothetical protein